MKLIIEKIENLNYLVESADDGSKKYYIEGTYLQSNVKNRNHRIYPKEILSKEVSRYVLEHVAKGRAVGELGHPSGPTINLPLVSHKIVELKEDGDNFYGKSLVLDTPNGQIVQNLLKGGVQLGVSSRGLGTLKENRNGIIEVQSDFYLATAADIVADPSAPDAFVNGIMEDVEFFFQNGAIKQTEQVAEIAKARIEEAVVQKSLSNEKMIEIFEEYLNSLIIK
jgi:hypothetical protein